MRMENLQTLRLASGLSRDALGRKAGVHSQTIAAHEYGRAHDVLYSIAKRLAEALEVRIDDLFLPAPTDLRIGMVPAQVPA